MDVDMSRGEAREEAKDDFGDDADVFDLAPGFSTPTGARHGRPMVRLFINPGEKSGAGKLGIDRSLTVLVRVM